MFWSADGDSRCWRVFFGLLVICSKKTFRLTASLHLDLKLILISFRCAVAINAKIPCWENISHISEWDLCEQHWWRWAETLKRRENGEDDKTNSWGSFSIKHQMKSSMKEGKHTCYYGQILVGAAAALLLIFIPRLIWRPQTRNRFNNYCYTGGSTMRGLLSLH